MARLFGTDGVRGLANVDLTPELALAVGVGAVRALGVRRGRTVVIGRDTRPSGEFLEAAVIAGLASAGADVVSLGVVPTPAVAHAVAASGADSRRRAFGQPQPDARQRDQDLRQLAATSCRTRSKTVSRPS